MLFVLLGRDPAAPHAIQEWVKKRIELGKNQVDDGQMLEALRCADTMEQERKIREEYESQDRKPVELHYYYFGETGIWPKPELKDSYAVLDHWRKLITGLEVLPKLPNISSGRPDHLVGSLDTLAFALTESLFKVQVLRESLTGSPIPPKR